MDILLQRQRQILSQLRRENLSVRELLQFFDDLIVFLNTNVSSDRLECYRLLTTICFDFNGRQDLGLFNHLKILKHPFFSLLSRTFEMLFTKLMKISLKQEEKQCLDAISLFITNLCLYKNEILTNFYIANNEKVDSKKPRVSYEKTFFTETFRIKFRSMLEEDLTKKTIDSTDQFKYQLANRFLRLWMKLNQTDYQFLRDGIVRCLKSENYLQTARGINLRETSVTPKEFFFLYQCPKFVRMMFPNEQEKIFLSLCEHLIDQSEEIFKKQLPIACEGESTVKYELNLTPNDEKEKARGAKIQSISWHIELLNFFALNPLQRFYFAKTPFADVHSSNDQKCWMIDQMIQIITTESLIKSVRINKSFYHVDVSLVAYSLVLLYNLIFDKKFFVYVKMKNPLKILDQLSQAKDKTIQFTSTTLRAILEKERIDEIENPTKIARSYLFMIENTIDEISHMFHGIKLEGVLSNLEEVVQNDQVKEEIVNEDGFNLLGECSFRPDLDFQTIRYPALRIIETISFATDASKKLVENERLMDHLNDLSRSTDQIQSPISKRILWIAENEQNFINEQKPTDNLQANRRTAELVAQKKFDEKKAIYQYIPGDYHFKLDLRPVVKKSDLVLNFSPRDGDRAQKIADQLKSTELYDVRLLEVKDDDPQSMAQTIEDSPIVVICCSNDYRNSNASRLEANFARKRGKKVIGLKMDPKFEINGWLEKICPKEELIDCSKTDFSSSIEKLEAKIRELKNEKSKK